MQAPKLLNHFLCSFLIPLHCLNCLFPSILAVLLSPKTLSENKSKQNQKLSQMKVWTAASWWSSVPPSCFTSLGFQPPPQSHICHPYTHFPTHLLLKATFHTLLDFICVSESVLSPPFLQLHSARLTEGFAQTSSTSETFTVFNLDEIFLPKFHSSWKNQSHFSDNIVYMPNSLQWCKILRIQSGP